MYKVYGAPFDVRLPEADERDDDVQTVVQPDISVVCDHTKLDDRGCKGSPDLIVEIMSPSTARKDVKEKFLLMKKQASRNIGSSIRRQKQSWSSNRSKTAASADRKSSQKKIL